MKRLIAVAAIVSLSGCLYQPYIKGKRSLSLTDGYGFPCEGQYHPSGVQYVTEGNDGGLFSYGLCPNSRGYKERFFAINKTAPDLPKLPVVLPNKVIVQ